ncbi:MAG: 4'-phosphopantetheinyl transferase superfamily protein [Desulfobacteraceae bacterium]|nr:4'-phosphopantetheinyl transferase superfamily protein [Desulfobacteraceae bacterium]
MLFVGNDIVDLLAGRTAGKSADPRFVERVLTELEKRGLKGAESGDTYLWALWAAKETAYKALAKVYPGIPSWPGKYEVIPDGEISGESCGAVVQTPRDPVRVILFISRDYIHCIGGVPGNVSTDMIIHGVEEVASCTGVRARARAESAAARGAAVRSIAACMALAEKDIDIRRHRSDGRLGPPMVYIGGKAAQIDLSLSHHGRFAAFAFIRNKEK